MRISPLYYSVAHRPFFILPRTAEAESMLVMKLLEHDASLYGGSDKLADKHPPRAAFVGVTGRTVVASAAQAKDGDAGVPEGSVAVIQMRGTMMKEGTLCSYGTEELAELMTAAAMEFIESADRSPSMPSVQLKAFIMSQRKNAARTT